MRSICFIPIFFALFLGADLNAQTTGAAAVATTQSASSNNWQNWAFTAVALVTAAAGVVAVSIDNGHSATNH